MGRSPWPLSCQFKPRRRRGYNADVALLTLHRPNFCSECGNKIVRLSWLPWTSRKFCDTCSPKHLRERIMQPVIVAVVLFLTGMVFGHALRPAPPPLIIQRSTSSSSNSSTTPITTITEEEIYTCGAKTKKGTPCSRRVHGPVRCWQHKGAKPMVAQEKLLIKE